MDKQLLEQIAECYGKHRHDAAVMSEMREQFPAVHFTQCNDDDIGIANPLLQGDGFNIYLMGGDHCLTLTSDYSSAKGVVLADVDDSDDD